MAWDTQGLDGIDPPLREDRQVVVLPQIMEVNRRCRSKIQWVIDHALTGEARILGCSDNRNPAVVNRFQNLTG